MDDMLGETEIINIKKYYARRGLTESTLVPLVIKQVAYSLFAAGNMQLQLVSNNLYRICNINNNN